MNNYSTNNKILSKWRFFNIKENPASIFLLLLICILVADIFLFRVIFDFFEEILLSQGSRLNSEKQPYGTNLHGYISLIYPFLIVAYSIFFYKNNSVFFRIHSARRRIYITLSIIASSYFVFITYFLLIFNSSCRNDYIGACGLMPFLGAILGLIICISIFIYSLSIFGKKINEFREEEIKTAQYSIFIILFFILVL